MSVEIQDGKLKLLILVDCSIVEVYVDGGRYCITSNVYPKIEQTECWIDVPYKQAKIDKMKIASMKRFWESEG